MCQSKAEGGRRCAFHLEQGVASGMVTYVASVTGLTPAQTNAAYEALEREGLTEPDPTRAEVDEFLEKQIFRVRHEPDLTEARRDSIVSRLRAAIGRITPNGATFHAWKTLVAESWSRVRRRAAAAFVVGALTFSVGACGTVPDADRGPVSAEPVAAAPTTPGAAYDTEYAVAQPTISKEAVEAFGAKEAAAATTLATEVAQEWNFNEKAIVGQVEDPAAVAYVLHAGDEMTPELRKEWTGNVNEYVRAAKSGGALSGDVISNVYSYTFFDAFIEIEDAGWAPAPEGPVVVNQKISKISTTPTTDGRLLVVVSSQADLRTLNTEKGKSKLWAFSRDTSYYMSKTPDGWKISAWNTSWTAGETRPDKVAVS